MLAQSTIDTRLRPLQAVKAVRRLMADPDATEEVFTILKAMRGRSAIRLFERFRKNPMGARILEERRVLLASLSDKAALAALSEGSLGRAYQRFMQAENLSPEGLVTSSQIWEEENLTAEARLFRERMRDMHDLTHAFTGYGRDPLGELCLLAFTFSHTRNLGMGLIVLMGFFKIDSWKVRRAVLEGLRHGYQARCWFPAMDWENLLSEPLLDLRRRFGISEPRAYRAVMA